MSEISELEEALVIAAADAEEVDKLQEVAQSLPKEYLDNGEKEETKVVQEEIVKQDRAQKRKGQAEPEPPTKRPSGYADVVASHYNQIEEKGRDERSNSRIKYLRNFHNWIKSMLINEYLTKIKDGQRHNAPTRVHDMCCGKGGDLLKWKKGAITHLICSDIAEKSLDQCKDRYNQMSKFARRLYSIEYIPGDCTRLRLREKLTDPSMKLDLVSCQFAVHYGFESLPQLECMLRNAAECLNPGGFFIGTTLDAYDVVARARRCGSNTYGNSVFNVTLDFDINKTPPLFGAKYNFQLDSRVNDCPEFLVHFPLLVKLAKKFGLKLVRKDKFDEYFERMKNEGGHLLKTMAGLEAYPLESSNSDEKDSQEYLHAKKYLEDHGRDDRLGTLKKSEWEASSLYTTFVFEKS